MCLVFACLPKSVVHLRQRVMKNVRIHFNHLAKHLLRRFGKYWSLTIETSDYPSQSEPKFCLTALHSLFLHKVTRHVISLYRKKKHSHSDFFAFLNDYVQTFLTQTTVFTLRRCPLMLGASAGTKS